MDEGWIRDRQIHSNDSSEVSKLLSYTGLKIIHGAGSNIIIITASIRGCWVETFPREAKMGLWFRRISAN